MYQRHLFPYTYALERLAEDSEVLDFGCGEGYGTALLSTRARKAIGVDVEPEALERARSRYRRQNLDFLECAPSRLPFQAARFDAVTSCQVLEHVADDHGFVSEAARVLKPGGFFLLTTPNRLTRLGPGEEPWNLYHLREYEPAGLERLLSRVFKTVQLMGVRASAEAERLEARRVRSLVRLHRLDPFRLRRWIPASVQSAVLGSLAWLRQRRGSPEGPACREEDLMGFRAQEESLEESLDLIALCRTVQ